MRDVLVLSCFLGVSGLVVAACGSDDAQTSPTTSGSVASGAGGDATSAGSGGGDATSGSGGDGGATSTTTSTATGTGGAAATECAPVTGKALAISRLLLGDTDPNGAASANAWKQYGRDIDGFASTPQSTNLCQPAAGAAPSNVYTDGNGGIDNSFGKNLMPLFLGLDPTFSQKVNTSILTGQFTEVLHLVDLPAGADQDPVLGRLYTGSPTAAAPLFDGQDCWPVAFEAVSDPGDFASAKNVFAESVLVGDAWDSGTTATLLIQLDGGGFPITLTVHEARLSMNLDVDHAGASNGQIAGILDTEEFIVELKKVMGTFDPSLCSGATFDSIANQMRQASDILIDGSQDPTKTCDAITIGLGFDMKEVQVGEIAMPKQPGVDPCQ